MANMADLRALNLISCIDIDVKGGHDLWWTRQRRSASAVDHVRSFECYSIIRFVGARVHDLQDVEAILDVFRGHGHTEVCTSTLSPSLIRWQITGSSWCRYMLLLYVLQVDTARTYTGGTSEEYLGRIDWRSKGLKIETKLYPNAVSTVNMIGAYLEV